MGVRKDPVHEGDPQYSGTVTSNYTGSVWNFYETRDGQKSDMMATITYENQISCREDPRKIAIYLVSPFYQYDDLAGSEDGTKNIL